MLIRLRKMYLRFFSLTACIKEIKKLKGKM